VIHADDLLVLLGRHEMLADICRPIPAEEARGRG